MFALLAHFPLFVHVAHTRLAWTRLVCTHIACTNIARVARMRTVRSHLASYLAHTLHHRSNTNGITVSHTLRTFVFVCWYHVVYVDDCSAFVFADACSVLVFAGAAITLQMLTHMYICGCA